MTRDLPAAPTADALGIRPRDVDQLCVDTIRMLAVDMVNAANSGHPGLPLGAADVAYVLWTRFLRYDPEAPDWRDRDRFVLSAGHGSALLYALLHVSGYDLPLDELRRFRQMDSRTPGHPERGVTPGVEVTTGPLGQGFANGVGIALAQRMLAERFATPEHPVTTHRTFALVSDGDLMEGVASEAASLAGHLGLGNLVYLYDSNRISIDGSTDVAFTEDVAARFRAFGWQVLECDGHDREAVAAAIEGALADATHPSLVVCRTVIGRGSPNRQGSETSHGSPLGAEETRLTKAAYGWPDAPTFAVPAEVYARFGRRAAEGAAARAAWERDIAAWAAEASDLHAAWDAHFDPALPPAEMLLARLLDGWNPGKSATRQHSGAVLQRLAPLVPSLVGGSADLTGSNNTWIDGSPAIGRGEGCDFAGRNIHFGVREHAMGAVLNGMAAHGSFVPYGGTFLAFLDYMRPTVRLASLSGHGSVFVFTHDSIGLGEDGPTHQPIEHVWTLRMIPGVVVHRPADGRETAAAWADAVARRDGPTALVLTRQALPPLPRAADAADTDLLRGGYVVRDPEGAGPALVLLATGSEVAIALEAQELLAADGVRARVVSMPSVELFDRQSQDWRDAVLPPGVPRVAIEAGRPDGWYRFVGLDGLVLGIEGFGMSAPAKAAFEHFGLTGPKVASRVRSWLAAR